jgi:hypothetical protein
MQIDDQDIFVAPFVLDQTVTPSQVSKSTLPTETMWFRVQANDSTGKQGAWSVSRRFEVKK